MVLRFMEWVRDYTPAVVSIVVVVVTLFFNSWQRRLGRELLRHQLYERRITIYECFRELLIALPEKTNDELKALFQKVTIARLEVPFLFGDDSKLHTYLDELCLRIDQEVIRNIFYIEGIRPQLSTMNAMNDHDTFREYNQRSNLYAAAKLTIRNDHIERLPKEFGPFLRLSDLSKRRTSNDE